jgi:hypothetical protein
MELSNIKIPQYLVDIQQEDDEIEVDDELEM